MFRSKKTKWRSLENAAKIFPATSGKKDERVFRMSCVLNDPIIGEKLQEALDITMQDFSVFQCVLRKGFFWNYFEDSEITPIVKKEYRLPCSQIYMRDQKSLLFEVTYYKKRINFETYHALTDGTGALHFLRMMVYHYLKLSYPEAVTAAPDSLKSGILDEQKEEDGFQKYYQKTKEKLKIPKFKAYQLRHRKMEYGQMQLTEGILPTALLLDCARKYQTTVTVLLTSVYLKAISEEMSVRQKKKPVALMIPVNLRNYFPSESMRNFFGWIDVGYDFSRQSDKIEEMIRYIDEFFKKELTKERIEARMRGLMDFEMNAFVRILPLELKLLSMQVGARASSQDCTAIFSNVGKIEMPEGCEKYIHYFDVFTSTPKQELTMCSYENNTVMSFTSCFENGFIEHRFFELLEKIGIPVERIDSSENFPDLSVEKSKKNLLMKCFTFFCLASAFICGMINWLTTPGVWWSGYAAGGLLCMWVMTNVAVSKRRDIMKNAVWQTLLVSIALILWDFFTGWNGWSIDFGFPSVILLSIIVMVTVSLSLKLESPRYMIYFLIVCVWGMLPGVLVFAKAVTIRLPSVICSGTSILVLLAFLIFQRQAVINELTKKFHINRTKG